MKMPLALSTVVTLAIITAWPWLGGTSISNAQTENTAVQTTTVASEERWEKEIRAFEESDKKTPPPADAALFIGSSSFRLWSSMAKDFAEIPVINRGFGGSEIADSTRLADRIVLPYKPRIIIIFAGGNDLEHGKTPAQVLSDFQAFAAKARTALPEIPIVYISINPTLRRWNSREKTVEANRLISEYITNQKKMTFINSYPALLGADGKPQKSLLREDELHLNSEGYKLWLSVIKPSILKVYEETKPKSQN